MPYLVVDMMEINHFGPFADQDSAKDFGRKAKNCSPRPVEDISYFFKRHGLGELKSSGLWFLKGERDLSPVKYYGFFSTKEEALAAKTSIQKIDKPDYLSEDSLVPVHLTPDLFLENNPDKNQIKISLGDYKICVQKAPNGLVVVSVDDEGEGSETMMVLGEEGCSQKA